MPSSQTAYSAGGDNARFRSETYKSLSFKGAFSNDDSLSRRQSRRLEGKVDGRTRARTARFKSACEPSVFLFAGGNIVSVKPDLAGLDSALVVPVGNYKQRHVVVAGVP